MALNDLGMVAVGGVDNDAGIPSIFLGDGTAPAEVHRIPGDERGWLSVGAINNGGDVAFRFRVGNLYAGESIRVRRDGVFEVVDPAMRSAAVPAMNASGTIAYAKTATHFVESTTVNLVTADAANVLASVDYAPFYSVSGGQPAINNLDQVVFSAGFLNSNRESGLVMADNGVQNIPLSTVGGDFARFYGFDLNDQSEIAFLAQRPSGDLALSVYAAGATLKTVAVAGDAQDLSGIAFPGLTNQGHVVFTGFDSLGVATLYYWRDGERLPVITVGQELFGSRLATLWSHAAAVNDRGQVAFGYELVNGRRGVARADLIPEPTAAVLALVAACAGAGMRLPTRWRLSGRG